MSKMNLEVMKEKISKMNAEELAKAIRNKHCYDCCTYFTENNCSNSICEDGILAWLNSEVKPQKVRYEFDMPESCTSCPLQEQSERRLGFNCLLLGVGVGDYYYSISPDCPLPSMVVSDGESL